FDFCRVWNPEAGSVFRSGLDRLDNLGMSMPQDGGSPGADIIDILVPVYVPDTGPLRAIHKERLAAHCPKRAHRRIDAARHILHRRSKDLFGFAPRHHDRYESIARAARFPSPRARITVAAPRTMSPPANTPGRLVMPCSSTIIFPH